MVLVAFIVGLFSFELALRIAIPEPENLAKLKSSSLFLYENKPNARFPYISNADNYNVDVSMNSSGFRGSEFKKEKDEGVFRIAVLGDSFEEALQVELSQTWQKVMARKLSEELKKPVEVYNFGVSGYGTDQEWLALKEKVWQFKPDMVILAFTTNDIGDTYKDQLVFLENGVLVLKKPNERLAGNWLGKLVRQTYTYHVLVKAASQSPLGKRTLDKVRVGLLGFPKEDKFFLSDAQLVQGPFEVIASQKNPPEEVLAGWRIIKALILDMKRQADTNGAKFLVTVNTSKMQIIPSDWENLRNLYKIDPESSSPNEISRVLGEFLSDNSISFYDPAPDALQWLKDKGDLHYKTDAHFNSNGHQFMGEAVSRYLLINEFNKQPI